MKNLPYNPGIVPTKPSPKKGDRITFSVEGLPPFKDKSKSIRNITHRNHADFRKLREKAIEAMNSRAWYFGPVGLKLELYGVKSDLPKNPIDYIAGICDTLDGSSGQTFTYLPIVFEDDCQVYQSSFEFIDDSHFYYRITIEFK